MSLGGAVVGGSATVRLRLVGRGAVVEAEAEVETATGMDTVVGWRFAKTSTEGKMLSANRARKNSARLSWIMASSRLWYSRARSVVNQRKWATSLSFWGATVSGIYEEGGWSKVVP